MIIFQSKQLFKLVLIRCLCRKICAPIVGVFIHETKWFSKSHPKANQSLPTVDIDTIRIRVFA